jgi:hypothetical protein
VPTSAQLQAESWWGREVVTPELQWLGDQVCARTGRPRGAAGVKGDQYHLYGAHRSQEWIVNSRWCQNRSYTVQSGLTAEQKRHLAAFDFVPGTWGTAANRRLMREITTRLVAAGKAGRLDGVTEVIGTLDGQRVTGTRVPSGTTFGSDLSHLDHLHLTFDRRHLRNQKLMERILAIVLGEEEDDVTLTDNQAYALHSTYWRTAAIIANLSTVRVPKYGDRAEVVETNQLAALTNTLLKAVAAVEARDKMAAASTAALLELVKTGGGNLDTAAVLTRLDQVAAAVAAQQTTTVAGLIREVERLNKALLAGAHASADVLDG